MLSARDIEIQQLNYKGLPSSERMKNQDKQAFMDWIMAYIPTKNRLQGPLQVEALAGDAGFRRYFRLNTQPSLIAVDSPPAQENNPAYVSVAMALQAQGIRTPIIYAVDFTRGFLLLEDFGYDLLQPLLNENSLGEYYQQAESTLLALQQTAPKAQIFPVYDALRLHAEMALFGDWFLGEMLGISLDRNEISLLDTVFDVLIESALTQPQVVVHRDYHSRNLMLLPDKSLGVIDFQDAVVGPVTYDLVSLLKDCYIRWPAEQMRERAIVFKAQSPHCDTSDQQQFLRWFDLMGMQRHIKVMGIFARLALRDGKQSYLKDLPLVIRYSLEAAKAYPETVEFYDWFLQRVEPVLSAQAWYSDWQMAGEQPFAQDGVT